MSYLWWALSSPSMSGRTLRIRVECRECRTLRIRALLCGAVPHVAGDNAPPATSAIPPLQSTWAQSTAQTSSAPPSEWDCPGWKLPAERSSGIRNNSQPTAPEREESHHNESSAFYFMLLLDPGGDSGGLVSLSPFARWISRRQSSGDYWCWKSYALSPSTTEVPNCWEI